MVVVVLVDGVPGRRLEHDIEIVESAEALEEGAKRRNGGTAARQEMQDIGVEGEAAQGDHRHQGGEHRPCEHEPTMGAGPSHYRRNHRGATGRPAVLISSSLTG